MFRYHRHRRSFQVSSSYHYQINTSLSILYFRVYERLQCLCTNEKDVIKAINDYYHPLDDWLLDIAETIHKNSDIVIDTNSINDHRSLLLALSSLRINQDTEITIRQHNYRQANNIINDLKTDQW